MTSKCRPRRCAGWVRPIFGPADRPRRLATHLPFRLANRLQLIFAAGSRSAHFRFRRAPKRTAAMKLSIAARAFVGRSSRRKRTRGGIASPVPRALRSFGASHTAQSRLYELPPPHRPSTPHESNSHGRRQARRSPIDDSTICSQRFPADGASDSAMPGAIAWLIAVVGDARSLMIDARASIISLISRGATERQRFRRFLRRLPASAFAAKMRDRK